MNPNSEGTIEKEILQKSLECIKVTTGRSTPKQSKWTITRHELDFGETIGGGGFSTVSKAQFRGTTVAVKLVKDVGKDVSATRIEIWSELRHDHIVPFYGASTLSSPPYIVSRYMRNGNLVQYLSRKPDTNRMQLLYEICLGMRFLHGANVVHGDLKSLNVLVDDSGKACITDFGLSKARSLAPAESNAKMIAGTLRFLAPEALRGQPLTFETDVYAFGMVIYEVIILCIIGSEMLTYIAQIFAGQTPFILEPDHVVMEGRLELKRPTSKEVYERGLDDVLWSLLSSCISRDPSRRLKFATIQGSLQSMKNLQGPSFSQEPDPGNILYSIRG
ncbi:kinase-like domain-containing protein [Melanogaster broomeanus]|nr:kinase-like domain-containing protein [Melanogaster broomeanus]